MFNNRLFIIRVAYLTLTITAGCIANTALAGGMSGKERARAATERQLFEAWMEDEERDNKNYKLGKKEHVHSEEEIDFLRTAGDELFFVRGAKADPYVLKMLYYYFGDAGTAPPVREIYCRRDRVIPMLRKMKKQGLRCDPRYTLSCVSKKTWNESVVPDIDSIIKDNDSILKEIDCSKLRGEYLRRE